MNDNEYFKFVGIINFFDIFPDFVYPIFEKEGKYYFQKTNNTIIGSFNEIKDSLRIKKIRFFDNENCTIINVKDYYCVGDEAVVSFQINSNEFFISNASNFIPFIKEFTTEDHILIEEIDAFLDIVNKKKNVLKKKIIG